MNPNEIKKALECCEVSNTCDYCPLKSDKKNCVSILSKNALAYIKQLEAEVERLKSEQEMADGYAEALEERAKSEAIKELAESVINDILPKFMKGHEEMALKISFEISQKAKEMVGENNVD